jgi:hypothetical protein
MKRKIRTKQLTEDIEMVYEEEMHELADAIAESSQSVPSLSDPFEEYIDTMRARIHTNPHIFRTRLIKGYNALLHVLQTVENAPENHLRKHKNEDV